MTSQARSPERGATAILVAISLLLLMGMAALAVDVGGSFDDRRQQQSAADVGSLAAVQYANTNHTLPAVCAAMGSLTAKAACRGAVEAKAVVAGTLKGRFTDANWTACNDPGDDSAGYTVGSGVSDCISYTVGLQKARVVLPTTQVATTFGRVLGVTSIGISSTAEAGADVNTSSDVIPFALGPTGAGGTQACMFANPTDNLDIAPCNGPVEGNFGFLDIAYYGNLTTGTTTTCTGDTQDRLAGNLILGADHPLDIWEAGPPPETVRNDVAYCQAAIFTASPNEVATQTGGSNTGLENGLFYGEPSIGGEGRLMCKSGSEVLPIPRTSLACVDVANNFPQFLDSSPLWDYLNPAAPSESSGACATGSIDTRQEMELCLVDWDLWPSTHLIPLFEADLLDSPRFAAVPELEFDPSNGTGDYLILGFKPVYLETIYMGCNANGCDLVYSPGETNNPINCPAVLLPSINTCGVRMNGHRNLRAMSAFIIDLDMLHQDILDHWPSQPGVIQYNLVK